MQYELVSWRFLLRRFHSARIELINFHWFLQSTDCLFNICCATV